MYIKNDKIKHLTSIRVCFHVFYITLKQTISLTKTALTFENNANTLTH